MPAPVTDKPAGPRPPKRPGRKWGDKLGDWIGGWLPGPTPQPLPATVKPQDGARAPLPRPRRD